MKDLDLTSFIEDMMIQNIECRILWICSTGHLGFEIVGYIGHGKAKSEIYKQNFSALSKVMGLAHDITCLLGYEMMKLSRRAIAAAGNHSNLKLPLFLL